MTLDALTAAANTGAGTDQLAGRDVAGKFVGAALLTDATGTEIDGANPLPVADPGLTAVIALLNELCVRIADVADSVGNLTNDTGGRLRVNAEIVAAHAVTLASTAVTTVTTLTNMAQVGGYAANQQIVAQTQMAEAQLRQNIVIS